jgi:ubiquinone/menaquinone biosynthesis C-methylase UbiE
MISKTSLLEHLQSIDHAADDDGWFATLEERKKKESQFHDNMRDEARIEAIGQDTYEQFHSNKRFYRTAQLSRTYFYDWIERHSRGKIVLDFACGNGDVAIHAARAGADLAVGIDISGISIHNARARAAENGLADRTYFLRGDCERTQLPDSSVDIVICAGVLHHLDLSYALPEIRRILAPNGKVIAFEALDYNPMIKLYRMRTPHLRTEWEKAHILSLKDVRFAKRFFDLGEVRYWHLTSMLGVWLPSWLPVLNRIDALLTRITGIQQMAWMFTFELLSNKKA